MQEQHESTKKVYEAPKVTDYGTLKEQTAAGGNTNPGDGPFTSS